MAVYQCCVVTEKIDITSAIQIPQVTCFTARESKGIGMPEACLSRTPPGEPTLSFTEGAGTTRGQFPIAAFNHLALHRVLLRP